jgi:hypothetical protein
MEESMKTLQISIVLCVVILFCGAAFAQQSAPPTITLNVPLQFTDLHPNVASIHVICCAYDDVGAAHPCAEGTLDVPCPASGNMNQTAVVVMRQKQDLDITRALSYSATFNINTKDGRYMDPSRTDEVEGRPKAGTPFTQLVRGDVHF